MKYTGIFKTSFQYDSFKLLDEFMRSRTFGCLAKVIPDNDRWESISVYSKGEPLFPDDLLELNSLINRIGRDSVVAVGYFNLKARGTLHRHVDMNGNSLFGIIRLHLPIQTNSGAEMEMAGDWYHLQSNVAYSIDTSVRHALRNNSDEDRIHLVIDLKKSQESLKFFPKANVQLFLHWIRFSFILIAVMTRDLFVKPKSLLLRAKSLWRTLFH